MTNENGYYQLLAVLIIIYLIKLRYAVFVSFCHLLALSQNSRYKLLIMRERVMNRQSYARI